MKLALKMALHRYFTRERLTYPTKVPTLSDKQVEKTNAEVKCALEKDTSGRGKYNEYMPEKRAQIGTLAAEHGPTKAVRHFSKLLSRKVPETMARRLKAEIFLGTWPMTVPLRITATAYGSLLLSLSRLHDNSSPTLGVHVRLKM